MTVPKLCVLVAGLMALVLCISIGGFVLHQVVWWHALIGGALALVIGFIAAATAHDLEREAQERTRGY